MPGVTGPVLLLQVQGAFVALKHRTRPERNGLVREEDFVRARIL